MEGEVKEKSSIISNYVRFDNLVWAVITVLVTILAYSLRDTFGVTGILVALLSIGMAFLFYKNYQLKKINKELTSEGAKRDEVREIYLKHLMEPNTICGYDFTITDTHNPFFSAIFKEGDIVQLFVISHKKFNCIVLTESNFNKFKSKNKKFEYGVMNEEILKQFKVESEYSFIEKSNFSCPLVMAEGNHVFIFTRVGESYLGDIEVNMILSDISSNQGSKNISVEQEKKE